MMMSTSEATCHAKVKPCHIQRRWFKTFLGKMEFAAQRKTLALCCMTEETLFVGRQDSRHATPTTPGHPQPTNYHQDCLAPEGQESKVVPHTPSLSMEKSLPTCIK